MGALGIKWLSRNEHLVPNILYITVNQNFCGMGIGLILNYELYESAHGCAGEVNSFMSLAKRRRIIVQTKEKFAENNGIINLIQSQESDNIPVSDVVEQKEDGNETA